MTKEAKTLRFIGYLYGKAIWADCDEFYAGKIEQLISGILHIPKSYYVHARDGLFEVRSPLGVLEAASQSKDTAQKIADMLAKEVK